MINRPCVPAGLELQQAAGWLPWAGRLWGRTRVSFGGWEGRGPRQGPFRHRTNMPHLSGASPEPPAAPNPPGKGSIFPEEILLGPAGGGQELFYLGNSTLGVHEGCFPSTLSFRACANLLGLLCADGWHPPMPTLCTGMFMVAPLQRLSHNAAIVFRCGDLCLTWALSALIKRYGPKAFPGTQPQRADQSGVWAFGGARTHLLPPPPQGKKCSC